MKIILESRKHFLFFWINAILCCEEIDELRVIVIRIILISITCGSNSDILFYTERLILFNKLLKKSSKVSHFFIDEIFEIV
jgi:hypothetical protein